jgi:hypothetical protein
VCRMNVSAPVARRGAHLAAGGDGDDAAGCSTA